MPAPCSSSPAGTAPARRLTSDMVLVHKVFRREFGMLPVLIGGVDAGDTARAALIAAHAKELSTALRHHHGAEQDLLWHRLRDRGALDESLHGRLRDWHREHFALLSELDGLLPLWDGVRRARPAGRPGGHRQRAVRAGGRASRRGGAVRPAGRRRTLLRARVALPGPARRELDPAAPDGLDARRDAGGRHRGRTQDAAGQGAGPGAVAVPNGGPGPVRPGDVRIARASAGSREPTAARTDEDRRPAASVLAWLRTNRPSRTSPTSTSSPRWTGTTSAEGWRPTSPRNPGPVGPTITRSGCRPAMPTAART